MTTPRKGTKSVRATYYENVKRNMGRNIPENDILSSDDTGQTVEIQMKYGEKDSKKHQFFENDVKQVDAKEYDYHQEGNYDGLNDRISNPSS